MAGPRRLGTSVPLTERILSFSGIYWIRHSYLSHPRVSGIVVLSGIGVVGVNVLYLPAPLSGSVTTVWLEVFILSVSEMSQSRMVCIKHTPTLDLFHSPYSHSNYSPQFLHYIKFSWSLTLFVKGATLFNIMDQSFIICTSCNFLGIYVSIWV